MEHHGIRICAAAVREISVGIEMPIAGTVKQYLDSRHIVYDSVETGSFDSPLHAATKAGIPPQALYYPIVLRDPFGLLMAVLPASRKLDFQKLGSILHRNCELALKTQLSSVFSDCQPGFIPPLGEAYGIRTIIDANLTVPDEVYIICGDNTHLIKLTRKDFMLMQTNAWLGSGFAAPIVVLEFEEDDVEEGAKQHSLRDRVEQISELPPMPEMANRIFELRADPAADVDDLVKVVELDPALAAQIMRYANSPYFSYRGQVDSIHTAISRVLGFDMVMNLALGLSLLQSIQVPHKGPLGLNAYWKHAIFSANLMQMLSKAMPSEKRPRAATCYLIGLLHDFGYLVLGHLFRDEYKVLNERLEMLELDQWLAAEHEYLDVDHSDLGYWLLKAWHLPEELLAAVKHHHDEHYEGPYSLYVHMSHLTDYLLAVHESGRADYTDIPQTTLQALGLTHDQIVDIMVELLEQDDNLESIARRLAA